jgi:hypothetical protein
MTEEGVDRQEVSNFKKMFKSEDDQHGMLSISLTISRQEAGDTQQGLFSVPCTPC